MYLLGEKKGYDEGKNVCVCYRSPDSEWKIRTSTLEMLKCKSCYIHEGLNNNHFETH